MRVYDWLNTFAADPEYIRAIIPSVHCDHEIDIFALKCGRRFSKIIGVTNIFVFRTGKYHGSCAVRNPNIFVLIISKFRPIIFGFW